MKSVIRPARRRIAAILLWCACFVGLGSTGVGAEEDLLIVGSGNLARFLIPLATAYQQSGDRSVVLTVCELRFAIGYGARADLIDGVRALAIAPVAGEEYGTIEADDVYAGRHPLRRDFYMYRTTKRGDAEGSAEATSSYTSCSARPDTLPG